MDGDESGGTETVGGVDGGGVGESGGEGSSTGLVGDTGLVDVAHANILNQGGVDGGFGQEVLEELEEHIVDGGVF